jgi:hypothetical protein
MISYSRRKDLDHFNMSIDKNKKKVLKQYPNAYVEHGQEGARVMNGNVFLAEEYFMPRTSDDATAWEYAAMACKLTQNFNRSHPMRMDLSSVESKLDRINKRKRRGRRAKKN